MTDISESGGKGSSMLADTVISHGYCVGCGACASVEGTPFRMELNERGQYEAALESRRVFAKAAIVPETVCPFSSDAVSEDVIGDELFGNVRHHNPNLGYYQSSFAGHVSEGEFRARGSSGGFGTWILHELFNRDRVDYIINVQPRPGTNDGNEPTLFAYTISSSAAEIQSGSKSRYYPIELSEVIKTVRAQPGRYAVVGLPCFIKSVRLLQRQDPLLAERIRYCIGLVCGHLKSRRYAESLAWQAGIKPAELTAIDFRVKDPALPANRYCTSASSNALQKVTPTKDLVGTDWGAGAFKYKACDFCDDVFAETADVVLGDAWLPQYVKDSQGTNVLVVRNQEINQLLETARQESRLVLDELPIEQAIASQDAGLRHRRDGLGYRLHREQQRGAWVPVKRIAPSGILHPRYERRRQDLRIELRELSHQAFHEARAADDLRVYLEAVKPVYQEYKRIKPGLGEKGLAFLRRKFRKVWKKAS